MNIFWNLMFDSVNLISRCVGSIRDLRWSHMTFHVLYNTTFLLQSANVKYFEVKFKRADAHNSFFILNNEIFRVLTPGEREKWDLPSGRDVSWLSFMFSFVRHEAREKMPNGTLFIWLCSMFIDWNEKKFSDLCKKQEFTNNNYFRASNIC